MDQERERIQEDLRGLVDGEVRCDDVFVQMYANDASIYEVKPLGVVRPRSVADVVICVQYASENGIAIHARGAGTGLAGESLGGGLILDFSHSMRRILASDDETVRLQPGVVLSQLNRHLAMRGRLFGPDPATESVTTMGSVLALDASGSHWLRYGSARDAVLSMQVVLADGTVAEVGRRQQGDAGHQHVARPQADENQAESGTARLTQVERALVELLEPRQQLIADCQPNTRVNTCGYQLRDVVKDGQPDLTRLFVGSEGTLALITEATIATHALPRHRGLALLFFDRLESAARAAIEVTGLGVSACDLMDRRLLSIARDVDSRYESLIPREAEAMLLVEQQGDDQNELREQLHQLVVRIRRRRRLAFDARATLDQEEFDLYWRLARRVIPTLYRLTGSSRALPFVEDVAIPPEKLPSFLVEVQNLLKKRQITASLFAHAGHGQLHVRPFLDLADQDHLRRMQQLAADLYGAVLEVGGTISGEHGDGLSRTWYVHRQYGPLYDVFREVKRIFDPQNTLNPGKVVAAAPQPLTQNLRPVAVSEPVATVAEDESAVPVDGSPVQLQLNWSESEILHAARNCNGCGRCRTTLLEERMCPIFRISPSEEASPRAKANLLRALLTGRIDPAEASSESLKKIADLCVHCHQCRLECPASVDIPKLMVECKAQYVADNGLRPSDWLLTRLDLVSAFGSLVSPAANWAIGNRTMRWLIEKTLGVAQGRKLPRFAPKSFLRIAHRRRLTRPVRRSGRKVLYFLDTYANWYDVGLAEAFVAALEHNGVAVYVHPRQRQAGMSMISVGSLERARKLAQKNVNLLAEAVRQGYEIVTTDPSAALCLTHEYPNLLEDDDAQLIAENTSEACTYLWRLHQHGKLELDLKPVNFTIGYHMPCHLRALQVGSPGEGLLGLIPGLTVRRIDKGCSGMAVTWGFKRVNYRSSLRAGWGLISAMREPSIQVGASECSSCKIQMEQGTTKPTIHPIKILALAYGLTPEAEPLLTTRSEELITT